jgi:hypothetical protein
VTVITVVTREAELKGGQRRLRIRSGRSGKMLRSLGERILKSGEG